MSALTELESVRDLYPYLSQETSIDNDFQSPNKLLVILHQPIRQKLYDDILSETPYDKVGSLHCGSCGYIHSHNYFTPQGAGN